MQSILQDETLLIQGTILVLAVLSICLFWWSSNIGSPLVAIFSRWTRWLFVSLLISSGLYEFADTGYSLGVLAGVSILLWFIMETSYNWLAISALSRSELPLFPKFEENEKGEEWPSNKNCISIKDWLRDAGLKRKQALISHLEDLVLMRVSIYENADETIRFNVLFLPNPRGGSTVCLACNSVTHTGDVIVTDNIFLPFGGFYPENWDVERSPWTLSAEKLLQRHRERIDAKAQKLMPFVLTPLEQTNEDQRVVEQLNRDLGFLYQPQEQEEHGRLTTAGKARIWQEIWSLSYLGLPMKYN